MIRTQYLALLRGINVGGKNIIKMSDLKECFENIGFDNVLTYIQSGNVIFRAGERNKIKLTSQIEKELSVQFNYDSKLVLITHMQLETIINEAPTDFGAFPDKYKYDVIFLRDDLVPNEIIKVVRIKEGVDRANVGSLTLYFSRLIGKLTQSRLKFIMTLPAYKNMTIRNWKTIKELLDIMNKNKIANA
jgi:uncharacterized protein (DUF1697 family)